MKRLRVGIIGGGHLGKIHTRLLAQQHESVQIVGVADPVEAARDQIAEQFRVQVCSDYRGLLSKIDAAIIATPTTDHYAVAAELLDHDVHTFIEKPLCTTAAEASVLVDLAQRRNRVLQVGHVERFNPAWQAALGFLQKPCYIEAVRTSGYTGRSTDIGVVLDLMIHDLDLILSIAKSPLVHVHAVGTPLFGPHEDMAQARLQFANGCVANLTASRTSPTLQRTMQVYTRSGAAHLDFGKPSAVVYRVHPDVLQGKIDVPSLSTEEKLHLRDNLFSDYLPANELPIVTTNAILQEQQEFVSSVLHQTPVRVSGGAGRDALDVAEQILEAVSSHRWDHGDHHGNVLTPAA